MSLLGVIAASCNRTGPAYVPPVQASTLRDLLYDSQNTKAGDTFLPTNFEDNSFLEASIVPESDHVKIYFTSTREDTDHAVCLATAPTMEGPFTIQGVCIANGIAAPAGRIAHSSGVVKAEGFYWCFALNGYGFPGDDRNVYLYRSPTGLPGSWTDLGIIFTKNTAINLYGFGNSTIWPEKVNGEYVALIDGADSNNIWNVHRYTATSMAGPWTRTGILESLRPIAGNMYGGTWLDYYNGRWHGFYHYGSGEFNLGGNLPTYLIYATSLDSINWEIKEQGYLKLEATPYGPLVPSTPETGTNQIADPCIMEVNGEMWHVAEYVENTSPIKSQLRKWRTGKTKAQFYNALFPPAT